MCRKTLYTNYAENLKHNISLVVKGKKRARGRDGLGGRKDRINNGNDGLNLIRLWHRCGGVGIWDEQG